MDDDFRDWFLFDERQRNYWSLNEEKAQFKKEAKEKRERERKQRALIRRAQPKPPPKRKKKKPRCLFQSFGSHCPKGHEYVDSNIYRVTGSKGPQRQCRTCAMARMRKYWHARQNKEKAQLRADQDAHREWLRSRPPAEGVSVAG